MNCSNCPYNNNGGSGSGADRPIIRHPHGNYLSLQIPMTIIDKRINDGVDTTTERVYPIGNVIVKLTRGKHEYPIVPDSVSVNNIFISDRGTLPIGTYDMAITFKGINGMPYEYKLRTMLNIVDSVADGVSYETDEFNTQAQYPVIKTRGTTIVIGDADVIVTEGSGFAGDSNPNDGFADINATYGDGKVTIGENDVTLTI